jgi:tricarballylate dehydrogenase
LERDFVPGQWDVVVVGSGNAALCAGIAAREAGADVLIIEKADEGMAGGNSKYTAGAMRIVYDCDADLLPLLRNPTDDRLSNVDFGSYRSEQFERDLLGFNDGLPLSREQRILIDESYPTACWLADHDVKFEPIFSRQSYKKDGKDVFWGGLTLAAQNEGVGLVEAELSAFKRLGGEIRFETELVDFRVDHDRICGVVVKTSDGASEEIRCGAVVLGCGGFQANPAWRRELLGENWVNAKVRGTPHNTGKGLELAFRIGARRHGRFESCHATPMDYFMPDYGNLDLPHDQRKNYRKICYFLGVMINADGNRFVDEGANFRNYTYAQFGSEVMRQPDHIAWQIFDAKVDHLLYGEYHFFDAHYVEADTLDGLIDKLPAMKNPMQAKATLSAYNDAVNDKVPFQPAVLDGKNTVGLALPKSNWAQKLDTSPFKAYPVTGGITFTYGGLEVGPAGGVIAEDGHEIEGLYACGELIGGVFHNGYPGGSGLTSGAVFGRRAGYGAARFAKRPLSPRAVYDEKA